MSTTDLEAAIDADPWERSLFAVYADELQRRGDPRGELIALQLAPRTVEREARANALIAQHGLGLDPPFDRVEWRWGFVDRVELDLEAPRSVADLETLLAHPSLRFLRALWLPAVSHDLQTGIDAIARSGPRSVSDLWLGSVKHRSDSVIASIGPLGWAGTVGVIDELLAALPRLESLTLSGQHISVARFASLGRLRVQSIALRKPLLDAIIAAPWPELDELDLTFGHVAPDPADVARLIAHPFPQLTDLRIAGNFVDEVIEPLSRSAVLPRLSRLAISGGLTEAGADVIAHYATEFGSLKTLDLSHNHLTPAAVERVAGIAPKVRTAHQSEPVERDDELYDY